MLKVAIVTVSDTRKKDDDMSGKVIRDMLSTDQFEVSGYDIVKDEKEGIKDLLIHYSDECEMDLIITNGGTGLGPRDVTPEATREVIDKCVPGFSECMRLDGLKKTKRALLSRGICGIRNNTLIINLPGSPKGARESLECILEILPHASDMMHGESH